MIIAIHAELNLLFLLILCGIAYQSISNVSQQMNRVLFRYTVYGVIISLLLDTVWILVDGAIFPGSVLVNRLVNALFFPCGGLLGGIWYLYVLETIGYKINRKTAASVMFPGIVLLIINLLSIRTEWIFSIGQDNIYHRGRLFWLQEVITVSMLLLSLAHIVVRLFLHGYQLELMKLLGFYIIPVIGTLLTLPFAGMPGTWNCAAASLIMMYIDDQDREITRDALTGLNNRKTLNKVFQDYTRLVSPSNELFLFALDLDRFKEINDKFGHPAGDRALQQAANLFIRSIADAGIKSMVARVGGDEFLIMGFFPGYEEALKLKKNIQERFAAFNKEKKEPYTLGVSIGFHLYKEGQSLAELIEIADTVLYEEKKRNNTFR